MSDKKEDCFCSAMKTAFLIILILIVFFLGYSLIYYGDMDYSSKISSGFSFLSSFGILATIGVYFWQRKDIEGNESKRITAACNSLSIAISLNKLFIKINTGNIINLHKVLESKDSDYIETDMLYAYPENGSDYIYIYKMTKSNLSEILMEVAHIDKGLYNAIFYYLTRIDIANIGIQISIKSNRDVFTKIDCIYGHLESLSKEHEKIISDMKGYKLEIINPE